MAASYRVNGDTFVPEKPRVWIPKFGGVVFLLNFFDERRRRVPATQ